MTEPAKHWLDTLTQLSFDPIGHTYTKAIAEHRKDSTEFPTKWQHERRIAYLEESLLPDLIVRYWEQAEQLEDYIARVRSLEMVLTKEGMDETAKEIEKSLREMRERQDAINGIDDKRPQRDRITPDMIERAKAYPFNELLEIRGRLCFCPFHENTKTPAMSWNPKSNTVTCHSECGKSWDTIAFVQDREGLTFPQAVRRLQ